MTVRAVRTTSPTTPPRGDPFWGDTSTIPPAHDVVMVTVLNKTNGAFPDSQVFLDVRPAACPERTPAGGLPVG